MSLGVLGQSPGVLTGRLGMPTVQRLNSSATTVTTGGTSTFGAWSEVVASSSDEFYILGFEASGLAGADLVARVGVGGSGSEVTVSEQLVYSRSSSAGYLPPVALFAPPRVAAASRISLSIAGPSSGTADLRLLVVAVVNLEGH